MLNKTMCLLSLTFLFNTVNVSTKTPLLANNIKEDINLNQMVTNSLNNDLYMDKIKIQKGQKTKIQEWKEQQIIKLEKQEQEKLKKRIVKEDKKQWQTFVLTFYSNLNCENGYGSISCTGGKLYDGIVASNYYKLNTKIQLQGWGEVTVGDKGSSNFSNDYRLDVYIPKNSNESEEHYFRRVNKMGVVKTRGIVIK